MDRIRLFTIIFVVIFAAFVLADVANGQQMPRPTGTATPAAAITTPTVNGPAVAINPTLRPCDYYFAQWGRRRARGTESDPFQLNKRISGKVMCKINSEEVDRIVNGIATPDKMR